MLSRIRSIVAVLTCTATVSFASAAHAQNTGGVFGPVVNEDHQALEYRIGHDPDSHSLAQRLHYQRSLDGQRMWRVIGQLRKTDSSSFDLNFIGGEFFWQLTDDSRAWQQGLRFDVRVRDDDRPHSLGVNWMHQFALSDDWRARLLLLSAVDVGSNKRDGLLMQTRAQLARRFGQGKLAGFELFNSHGPIDDLPDFDDQSVQMGPFVSAPLGSYQLFGHALFGLTDGAADLNFAVWVTRQF